LEPALVRPRGVGARRHELRADWLAAWEAADAHREKWPAVQRDRCNDLRRPGQSLVAHELRAGRGDERGFAALEAQSREPPGPTNSRRARRAAHRLGVLSERR